MLNIRQVKHLARHLGVSADYLVEAIESIPSCCEELEFVDPAKPDKVRVVLNIFGRFRRLQDKMLRSVLLPKIRPSEYSHGGVTGRDIKSNVQVHAMSAFAFVTDISNFYPSIPHARVYQLFTRQLGCAPDVARLCTRLCTFRHHLALGLPTSPILADQLLGQVDQRIGGACAKLGLSYTRFVDDLAISGPFDLAPKQCGIAGLIVRILSEHGFAVNLDKHRFGRMMEDFTITGLRIHNGHLDVRRRFIEELDRQLDDAASLARGGEFVGPYFTEAQIAGRARFVCWINPGRKRQLTARMRSIPWKEVAASAQKVGLIAQKKRLRALQKDALG